MYSIGIDLGGTNIAVGVVDDNCNIVGFAKIKTNAFGRSGEEIVKDMADTAKTAVLNAGLKMSDISFVGVGSPGACNPITKVVATANNLNFHNFPIGELLENELGVKVFLENDANAAAYGEFIAGAGKGTENFVAITLGTGVGGGIIINSKLFSGSNYAGGELGHTVISVDGEHCSCGRNGCFEAYASATALIRQTKEAMLSDKNSLMWEIAEGNIDSVNGRTAFEGLRKNDETAIKVVRRYQKYIAEGLTNIINVFQPELICIGGGISNEKETLVGPIREMAQKMCYTDGVAEPTKIIPAALGNDAGIIGAAMLYKLYQK